MRRTASLALLALLALVATACGTSGGESSGSGDGGDSGGDSRPTSAQLAELLPTAEEVGDGYEMSSEELGDDAGADDEDADDEDTDTTSSSDDEDEERDPTEQAIIDACPGAEILDELDTDDDNPDEVSREFETEQQATIEVALDPTPDRFDEETVDQVIEALSDCGTIETEDEMGSKIEMEISAERNDEFGDFGVELTMDATFSLMGSPVDIEFRGLIFSVDGTSVSVTASSGLDENTFEATPGDYDLIPELAGLMEERVSSL